MRIPWPKVYNFFVFELAWLACVLSAAAGRSALGLAVAAAVLGVHLVLARQRLPELRLIGAACVLGAAWDSAVMATGLVAYVGPALAPGVVPAWMVALWALFATTLNLSLSWLQRRHWLGAALGAIGGPLAYLAGVRLGAIETDSLVPLLLVQGLGYAVLVPVLAALAARWNGFAAAPGEGAAGPPVASEFGGDRSARAPARRPL